MDVIKFKRIWNQRIINILYDVVLSNNNNNYSLCTEYADTQVQDMEFVLKGFEDRESNTILCNKCELVKDMIDDEAYFIV